MNELRQYLIRKGMEDKIISIDEYLTSQKCYQCSLYESNDVRMQHMTYNNSINTNKKIKQQEKTLFIQYKYENFYNPTIDKEKAKAKKLRKINNKLHQLNNKKNLSDYEKKLKIKLETPVRN